MEVIVIDGEPRPLPECHIEREAEEGASVSTEVRAVEYCPITVTLMTTQVMETGPEMEYVHISDEDTVYELRDVFVSSSNATVGEPYGEMEIVANRMSARTMHHKI